MPTTVWDARFLRTTRGKIVDLLRRESRTVEDLARELELTRNAVRGHLTVLERDGLIRPAGHRRGSRRPAVVYALSPAGEARFSQAYAPLLKGLLDELSTQLDPAAFESLLRKAGRRLTPRRATEPQPDEAAVATIRSILAELGGTVESVTRNGKLTVRGVACPLADVTGTHAPVCCGIEALLSDATGRRVTERCERGPGRPRCVFDVE